MVGKIRGHVGEARRIAREEARERAAEGKRPGNKLLSKKDLQGEWDATRVMFTTMGGELRPLTSKDLDAFRKNMEVAQKAFKGGGITARQVLDLATNKPLRYKHPDIENAASDIEKAKRQIRNSIAASAKGDTVRFVTSASQTSKVTKHHVTVKMHALKGAIRQLAIIKQGDKKAIRKVAAWLVKQKLSFDCDCERHRYFFRYVATIGGFAAGRPETAYPKITNPRLQGVACMHVIRTMNEIDSSSVVLAFFERLLTKIHASDTNNASLQTSEKDAQKQLKARKRAIKTTGDRETAAQKQRAYRAAQKAARSAKRLQGKKPAATKRYEEALASGQMTTADLIALLVKNNIDPGTV